MKILILPSVDGPDWTHAILYPDRWTTERADELVLEAFTVVQAANPEEWSWEDYAPELVKRGFVLADWHEGPAWDEEVLG